MAYMDYINEIWNQIKVLTPTPILWSWGVSAKVGMENVGFINSPQGDVFRLKCMAALRLTCINAAFGRKVFIYICVAFDDTYTIIAAKPRKKKVDGFYVDYAEIYHKQEGIYFDEMPNTIDELLTGKTQYNKGD